MKQVPVQDLTPGLVRGLTIQLPGSVLPQRETYFEWSSSALAAGFNTREISGGVLRAWRHTPVFREIETHVDAEMFYFVSGVALMLFMDLLDGQPDLDSAQVVRIQPGTQLLISAGKAHFVPVAEGDCPVEIIVVSPRMEAPRMALPAPVEGLA